MTAPVQSLGPENSVYQGFTKARPFDYGQGNGFYFKMEEGQIAKKNQIVAITEY